MFETTASLSLFPESFEASASYPSVDDLASMPCYIAVILCINPSALPALYIRRVPMIFNHRGEALVTVALLMGNQETHVLLASYLFAVHSACDGSVFLSMTQPFFFILALCELCEEHSALFSFATFPRPFFGQTNFWVLPSPPHSEHKTSRELHGRIETWKL